MTTADGGAHATGGCAGLGTSSTFPDISGIAGPFMPGDAPRGAGSAERAVQRARQRAFRGVDCTCARHDNARAEGRTAPAGTVLHFKCPWTYTLVAPPTPACIGWRRQKS